MAKGKRVYILYDGRACGGKGTDEAQVLVACGSAKEAASYKGQFGQMACYSYKRMFKPARLEDEKWEWDYQP